MITRTRIVQIQVTPEELAREFSNMDASAQAEFFNELALCVEEWSSSFTLQVDAILCCEKLAPEGKRIMEEIGRW